jgi:hypothetical protein
VPAQRLISENRTDDRRYTAVETRGGRACATMVHCCSTSRQEHVVVNGANDDRVIGPCALKPPPACGNDRSSHELLAQIADQMDRRGRVDTGVLPKPKKMRAGPASNQVSSPLSSPLSPMRSRSSRGRKQ